MAINTLMQLSNVLRPGYYGGPKVAYGIPIASREDMSYADAKRTFALLEVFERLKLFRNVTMDQGLRKPGDNELYYRITIWENFNVKS
jgi:hypothetical protein